MTYSYDPGAIADGGLNQMRFELGDVDMDAVSLGDEEILAALSVAVSWDAAVKMLTWAIYRRYAHEVDIAADGMKIEASQRAAHWRQLAEENELKASGRTAPRAGAGRPDHGGYFYAGMLGNPRAGRCGGGDG